MIKPVYQQQGVSSHMLARDFGKSRHEKATHTGTLDPMAEGVLIILSGDDRYKKQDLGDVQKTYQFEILWGIKTDSQDLLGLITEDKVSESDKTGIDVFSKKEKKSIEFLDNYLSKYVGKINQRLPRFSAKRVKGKSAFDLAKSGEEMEDFFRAVEIFEAKVISLETLSKEDLKDTIIKKINNVEGDFRQEEVLSGWEEFFAKLDKNDGDSDFYISKCEVTASRRTYIRALVRDLSEDLSIPATTFSIVRTKNGEYGVEDCTDL
jgi:tRNA pseudouridine(55) synthase